MKHRDAGAPGNPRNRPRPAHPMPLAGSSGPRRTGQLRSAQVFSEVATLKWADDRESDVPLCYHDHVCPGTSLRCAAAAAAAAAAVATILRGQRVGGERGGREARACRRDGQLGSRRCSSRPPPTAASQRWDRPRAGTTPSWPRCARGGGGCWRRPPRRRLYGPRYPHPPLLLIPACPHGHRVTTTSLSTPVTVHLPPDLMGERDNLPTRNRLPVDVPVAGHKQSTDVAVSLSGARSLRPERRARGAQLVVDFGQELVTAVHKAVRWTRGRPTDAEFRALFMVRRGPPHPAATRPG